MKVLATIIFIIINITASGFYELDTKASSMGGAGLTSSAYFNPAILAGHKKVNFSLKAGGDLKTNEESSKLLEDMKKLASPTSNFDTSTENLSKSIIKPLTNPRTLLKLNNSEKIKLDVSDEDVAIIKDAKRVLKNLNNIMLDISVGAGVNLDVDNYSLAFIRNISMDIIPRISNNKLEFIQAVGVGGQKQYVKIDLDSKEMYKTSKSEYDNKSLFEGKKELENSKIDIKLVSLLEVPFIYSYRYNMNYRSAFDGHLNLGVSMKYMKLQKTTISINPKDNINPSSYVNQLNDNSYSSGSLDFGLLYFPKKLSGFKTGLVLKNITSPKFDDKTLSPMIRYGLAFSKHNIHTAFDYDITKNKTLSGKDTQIMGGGIGYNPFSWLGANIGFKQDLANKDLGTIMTAGFNLPLVQLSTQFVDKKFYQFQFNLNI